MNIDREEVKRIATLANLEFEGIELDRMAEELSKILGYVDQLNEVDFDEPDKGSSLSTPMREDEPRTSTPLELIERNAPDFRQGFFVVPKVIGGE